MKFINNVMTVLVRVWKEIDGTLKPNPVETSLMKGLLTKMWAKLREPIRNEKVREGVPAIPRPEGPR